MKKRLFFILFVIVFIVEIFALVFFSLYNPKNSEDTVEVNEVVQTVTKDFYNLTQHKNQTILDYVVIDNGGNILFKTKLGISESLNEAVSHKDTILDITKDNETVGKVIIFNEEIENVQRQKKIAVIFFATLVFFELAVCVGYALYIQFMVIRPFRKLKGFAERIANGNLEIPLEMDKQNIFGAFTESFDIMRSELKKARLAEAQANLSKKELVAKLSHDIKTPISSIKAVAEVGLALSKTEKDEENYTLIIGKSDQINTLVTNLFTATLEDLKQLSVTPKNIESTELKQMIENSDYLKKATIDPVPECLVFVDSLRLQQVFDNIFANSYKYANTDICVNAQKVDNKLCIIIEDYGGGVMAEEIPHLKEKYKRGTNSQNLEGAGLGLYISDYFMKEMQGALDIENGNNGLKVTISLMLSGNI